MRTDPLKKAIAIAGGVQRLADALGIRQPSVSGWKRTPVLRVLDVERITGVPRSELRPDIYPADPI